MSRPPLAGGDHARAEQEPSPNPTAAHAQDVRAERAALIRDFISEALRPVEADAAATRASLANNDDTGAAYHLRRVVACVKAAASTFNELKKLGGGQ